MVFLSLYEVLKEELSNLQSLRQFGIGHDDSAKLLSLVPVIPSPRFDLRDRHPLPTKSQPPEGEALRECCPPTGGTPVTLSSLTLGLPQGTYVDPDNVNGVIQFANDLERDPKYAGLPGLNVVCLQSQFSLCSESLICGPHNSCFILPFLGNCTT